LVKEDEPLITDRIITLLKITIELYPKFHDAYIELGNFLNSLQRSLETIEILKKFPFEKINQDDLYIHGEITRLLMKEKMYKDPSLVKSLIVEGKHRGIKYIQDYVDKLDSAGEYKLLVEVFCAINAKTQEDSDMKSFFKAKLWL
jgi:hypothetical protein